MKVNDMVKLQTYQNNLSTPKSGEKIAKSANTGSELKLEAQNNRGKYPPPNWDKIITKREPIMSDEEFKEAIKAQVAEDAANGISAGDGYHKLYRDYVSVVSPDRKAAFLANPNPGGKKLSEIVKGKPQGVPISVEGTDMVYSPGSNMWMTFQTAAEMERGKEFRQMYGDAYAEYERIHGEVDRGRPGIKTFMMYG